MFRVSRFWLYFGLGCCTFCSFVVGIGKTGAQGATPTTGIGDGGILQSVSIDASAVVRSSDAKPSQMSPPLQHLQPGRKKHATGVFDGLMRRSDGHTSLPGSIDANSIISSVAKTSSGLANATKGSDPAHAMHVTFDGTGDTWALMSSISFSFVLCAATLAMFLVLRSRYPMFYLQRELDGCLPSTEAVRWGLFRGAGGLSAEEVIQLAGLDGWLHLEFHNLGLRIILCLGLVPLVFCPIHWAHSNPGEELLTRLGLSVTEDRPGILWAHAFAVWYVVLGATRFIFDAQRRFLPWRMTWLQQVPEIQATTVLVEEIPEAYRSDERLRRYFAGLFSEESVVRAYVVRNTTRLRSKLDRFASASRALKLATCEAATPEISSAAPPEHCAAAASAITADGNTSPSRAIATEREPGQAVVDVDGEEKAPQVPLLAAVLPPDAAPVLSNVVQGLQLQLAEIVEEVAAERARVARVATAYDPDVCSNSGLVTFRTRRDARLASREQLRTDECELVMQPAPHAADIMWENVLSKSSMAREAIGGLLIGGLFILWSPVVIFISGLLSVDSLKLRMPFLAKWCDGFPLLNVLLEGVLATLGLNILMGSLPSLLWIILTKFFRLKATGWVEVWLERIYFGFLIVFVLLVTGLSQGLIATMVFIASTPTAVLPLFAKSLALASHFYLGYMVLGCLSCVLELLRIAPLSYFLYLKAFRAVEPEAARKQSEDWSVMIGPRVGKSVFMLVVALVFSSLSPLILVFAGAYFLVGRIVYGYLACFAEPRHSDLGGVLWVISLKQVQMGLFLYVLLMLGVIGARGGASFGPFVCVVPSLFFLAAAWRRFDSKFLWENLPLEEVMLAENAVTQHSSSSLPGSTTPYIQEECRESELSPPCDSDPEQTSAGPYDN